MDKLVWLAWEGKAKLWISHIYQRPNQVILKAPYQAETFLAVPKSQCSVFSLNGAFPFLEVWAAEMQLVPSFEYLCFPKLLHNLHRLVAKLSIPNTNIYNLCDHLNPFKMSAQRVRCWLCAAVNWQGRIRLIISLMLKSILFHPKSITLGLIKVSLCKFQYCIFSQELMLLDTSS